MQMTIGGVKVDSTSGKRIDVYCPADGQLLDSVPAATEAEVGRAVGLAVAGQRVWEKVPLHERVSILERYIRLVDTHKEEIARTLSLEQGRPYAQNLRDLEENVHNILPGYLDVAKRLYGKTTVPGAYPGKEKDFQVIVREPLGVIVAIIPFNSPINLFLKKAIPALVLGNALVVKPASDDPLAMVRLVDLFVEAGVTPEAISCITGSGSNVGRWLALNPHVAAISFTGSTEVGKEIVRTSSVNLTRCFMELGGNDVMVVLADADLDLAVHEAIRGRTNIAGQVCASPKRYLVQREVAAAFTDKLIAALQALVVGQPLEEGVDLCCLINEKAATNAEEQIRHTVAQGATLAAGGGRNGTFLEPTVLTGVTRDMDVAKDMEIFAPVFPIIAVADTDEAIDIANASVYGLSGSVFSRDLKQAFHVANALKTGQVVVNGSSFYMNPDAPFGGYKQSGLGREGISVTLQEFSQEKTITIRDLLY
jgi:succinate-semialdehyde dehydrogenase/glutarate-semialdehyde dehydrogenase